MSQYAWIFGLVGNLLVFIGWVVVYINAKNISTRSEIKSVVDSLVKNYTELSELGMKYWFNGGSDYESSEHYVSIAMSKVTLSYEMIRFLNDRGLNVEDNLAPVSYLLTYECENVSAFKEIERYLKANKINSEVMTCINDILDSFHKKYPPSHYIDLNAWHKSLGPH